MSDGAETRRINVTARDQAGQLLQGTTFAFELAGEPAGSVTDSDGRTDYNLSSDEPGPLKVTATYRGKSKSETIDVSESTLGFVFETETEPKKVRKTSIILAFLLAIIAIGFVSLYVFRPWQPSSETERAASQIAQNCAGGREVRNEGKITAGLSGYLSKVAGETSVKSAEVGTVTQKIASDEIGLRFYQAYTQCLKDQTKNWLQIKGVRIDPSGDAADQPVATSHNAAAQ